MLKLKSFICVFPRGPQIPGRRVKLQPREWCRHAGAREQASASRFGYNSRLFGIKPFYLWNGGRSTGRGSESAPVWTWQPLNGTHTLACCSRAPATTHARALTITHTHSHTRARLEHS